MISDSQKVRKFLLRNGFEKEEEGYYISTTCAVKVKKNNLSVQGGSATYHSTDLNLYWLIGVLIVKGFFDADFMDFRDLN